MNLLPETMADASISRMTCARCGAMMDLPPDTPAAATPEPPLAPTVRLPPSAPEPYYEATPDPDSSHEADSSVNGPLPFAPPAEAYAGEYEPSPMATDEPTEEGDDQEPQYYYDVPPPPPKPDRTGRFFKIAARLLLLAAIVVAVVWFLVPMIRQYLASPNRNNIANKPKANLPPPVFTPTPVSTNTPAANTNAAPNTNTGPMPTGSTTPSPSPAPVATPTIQSTPPPPANAGSGNFSIQVGSHPDAGSANNQVAQLQAKGISARAVQAAIPGRGTWYRVRIGRFPSREEATRYGAGLRSQGVANFYVTDDGK